MRTLVLFSLCLLSFSLCHATANPFSKIDQNVDIQLQEAEYGDGLIQTKKGGIIKGKDFSLQAMKIRYLKTNEVNKIEAEEQLFLIHKKRTYRGDRAELDLTTGKITVWNGCSQIGLWFVGGEKIEIFADGHGIITNAQVTTSENERSDWTLRAQRALVTKKSYLQADNVAFYFIRLPIFWIPSFSTDMFDLEGGPPFRYRARWGGREGGRIGISYLFKAGTWNHRALLDYSIKNGFGTGIRSKYRSEESPAQFDALNYIAQDKKGQPDTARYRVQGLYKNYYDSVNVHFKGQYDKLSDKRMKYDFTDHAVSDVRAQTTKATFWRSEPNWKAQLDSCVRLNSFQNIKQKLPLFTFNARPQSLGNSPLILHNTFSAGYLDYVYAKETPNVHNFHSSREELSQTVYASARASLFSCTPSLGYTLIHYSNSPQHNSKVQAIGKLGLGIKTRLIHVPSQQILEPYVQALALTRPTAHPNDTYIFGLNDGWAQINSLKYGLQHTLFLPTHQDGSHQDGFHPQLRSNLYSQSFYATKHLSQTPYKLWLTSTWDSTSRLSYKLESAWNIKQNRLDHLNVQMRRTLSNTLALVLEWRQRSSYSWRKLDQENFVIEAIHSPDRLRSSQMSDNRKTLLAALAWSPIPTLDIDVASWSGWRRTSPKRYYNFEANVATIIRGALRVTLTYYKRPGGLGNGWNLSFSLGPKKEKATTAFKKIGQGAYDLW